MPESGSQSEEGVYYRREDYVGVWRRLLIETIDFGVASAFSLGVTILLLEVFAPTLSQEEMSGKP